MKNPYGIKDSIFIKCDCFSHAMQIDRTTEEFGRSFEISCWQLVNCQRPLSFRERLRWCWRILKTGMPWVDMLTISDDSAKEIADFIIKHTKT